ncbi:flavodoxin-dependent (E)-4-hydroxy-3-methylbut-2-enyl-diphosphate synthase [Negativicoccus succinicivorans]|uniref:flavodoxin-dependent (E)-4-hydroxy-3-methylbut-2-enyl-diphosphate synthase n=1 Tax=Negativicoccus succinicivorans TaxID=620903 RepID=UPI002901CEEE|nr:flavodoxin-dependent (E)-4-hydroxy-3-methylbut-2-enyl-diphosphate synthase [Negativicoccus succinicivorans]MDU2417356.1 flavodoxin-dependent (E)-4-hydroxy-3-methylbut-2-enyl-diphosphate synthase [Negativicoccus succinicivorans]
MTRRKTRQIHIGQVAIGGDAPVSIQSMSTFTPTDITEAVKQINELADAGCDIVRLAVPNRASALALKQVKAQTGVPLVADIHFDYRLALDAIDSGVDGLRINPGNIGSMENVLKVVEKAKPKRIPIRIGINAGSLPEHILKSYGGHPTAQGMVASALEHIRILEQADYREMKISLKSTDVPMMVEAYRTLADQCDYPLHLGVTEAGTVMRGSIKSAMGIGALLLDGIGDTIRVSLTANPVEEVKVAKMILQAAGYSTYGVVMISCPTCGRCQVDLISMAAEVEKRLEGIKTPLRVAVMGCVVNGPGEAREADFGIAGGNGQGVLFRKGKVLRTVFEDDLVDELMKEINQYLAEEKKV